MERRISKTVLANLTSDTANDTEPSATVCTDLITRACSLIDAYAGQVYTVPFTTIPQAIKDIAIDLSCYYALQRRPANYAMPKEWENVYNDSIGKLEKISNEFMELGLGR